MLSLSTPSGKPVIFIKAHVLALPICTSAEMFRMLT